MNVVSDAFIAVLGLWLVATIVNSFSRGTEFLERVVGPMRKIVPKWNFFSPHPGQHDYHLLYRDRRVDGSVSTWQQVAGLNPEQGRFRWIWNPNYHWSKVLFDAAQALVSSTEGVQDEQVPSEEETETANLSPIESDSFKISVMFLTILHIVSVQDHSDLGDATQFMIMRSSRADDEYEPVFISGFHELE